MYNFLRNIFGVNNNDNTNDQEIGSLDDYRVSWQPNMVRTGDSVHITYQGLLKDANAQDVYLHYGFDSWSKDVRTVKMDKQNQDSFGVDIHIDGNHEMNFCFKDGADHWDNNDGYNWNVPLQ